MPPPHDIDAERDVIGACLVRKDVIGIVAAVVDPSDFYVPAHETTFAAIVELWRTGEPVDARTVSARLAGKGLSPSELTAAMGSVPQTAHAERYARTVVEHRARRRLLGLAEELRVGAQEGDPGEVIDNLRSALAQVDLPSGRVPDDLMVLDDMLDRPVESRTPWVVPGLLRQDWRVIVVAPEGAGKTLLLQQVAVMSAQGIHPLTFREMEPIRVLIVDLENPEDRIVGGCLPIRDSARKRSAVQYERGRAMLWHRPGGIDLRSRSDVAAFEAVLESVRPQLVVLGPAYKASKKIKGEGWDDGALAVMSVLDSLRTRFGFGLLMEDHAGQGSGGVRDLRPFGSARWLAWPEIGIKLAPEGEPPAPRSLAVKRWRGDRLPNDWPERLEESKPWPWAGVWPNGMPSEEAA